MTKWPPRVLSNLYRNGLQTFYDLLLDLLTKSLHLSDESGGDGRLRAAELRKQAAEMLIADGDPADYCILLKDSYAVMAETAPSQGRVSFEQRWSQEQIVDRVIFLQFRLAEKPSHVLCAGYRKLHPLVVNSGQRRSPPGLECVFENSSVHFVNSPSWRMLLSRVGDLVMLHVLTYAAIFCPLPNNCFIQVSGGPSRCAMRTPGRSLSVHPGEEMLGSAVCKKWKSKSGTRQVKEMHRNLHSHRVEDKEKQPARYLGVVRNQTSNFTFSPSLKRQRTESVEPGMEMDVLDGYNKHYNPSKSQIGIKRPRPGSGENVCHNCKTLRPDKADTCKGAALQSDNNSQHDLPAMSSKCNILNLCSSRASGGSTTQSEGPLNDDRNPQSRNFRKRRKLNDTIETDRYSQEENNVTPNPTQASADYEAMVPQVLNRGKKTKRNTQCRTQTGESLKHEATSTTLSHIVRGNSRVGQDTCSSTSKVGGASSSNKRARLPSWKRRKLRKAQESCQESVLKDPPLQSFREVTKVESSQVQKPGAKVEEVVTKAGEELSPLHPSIHPLQASDKPDSACCLPFAERADSANFGRTAPKDTPQAKKSLHGSKAFGGVPERIIDRAPLFYNSNYSCRPGLPAKHILNTPHQDESGVARLFSDIFGDHCQIVACSVLGGHMHAINGLSKIDSGRSSQCRLVHKLLHELLSKARRCAFSRLLGRHCPLPDGFYSIRKDSPPRSALYETLTTETADGEPSMAIHEDKKPATEVQEIMSLWLGQNFPPRGRTTTTKCTSPSKVVPERAEFSSDANQKLFSSVEMTERPKQDNALTASLDDNLVMEKNKLAELISCYTTHNKVVGFLWAVCRSIIPQQMLGCLRSWRALRSIIAHFVGLRRHEKFNLKHALFKLRLSSFSWLAFQCNQDNTMPEMPAARAIVEERALQQKRLELWLYWLFTSLVVPLIRAHFYVTENESHRQNIFYYRKPVWARIRLSGMRELMTKNYKKLSKPATAQIFKSRVLGFSQIRLLPKETGLRPIANLAAPSRVKLSMLTERKATLRQVFGNISTELSADECSHSAAINGSSSSPGSNIKSFRECRKVQKRSKEGRTISFRSINSELRDAYSCLKLEKEAHPEDLGSSVFGYCDVHKKVLPFIMQLKESPNGMPRLFMAVCDMTKAYDNIPQEKLQEIAERFVHNSNYKIARYTCITPTLASVRVSHGRTSTPGDEPKKFVDSVSDLATKRSHCIFVDQAFSTSVPRDRILALLREHVTGNIVQIGSHFYQQKVGIPQGSVLSSLLCSLFYGHFDLHSLLPVVRSRSTDSSNYTISAICERDTGIAENSPCLTSSIASAPRFDESDDIEKMLGLSLEVSDTGQDDFLENKPHACNEANPESELSELQENSTPSVCDQGCDKIRTVERDSVLLRLIDDSLFISTSEQGAKLFVESMHRGSKEYGCQANSRKTTTSFCLQLGNEVLPRKVYRSEDGACFIRWSGLLVNCFTLEFQADYTRYSGEHIRSALTVRRESNQGWQLVLKMCQYMRPKCHALFFDPRINSPATIRLNAFQAFLLCAMKFHAYVCCLPRVTGINEPFLYKAFDCVIRYMYGLLRHKMHSVGADAQAYFPYKELEWLALVAFYRVLKRKQARYPVLVHMLRTKLQMAKYAKLRAYPHLSSATDERRSSMFKSIKY